MSDLAIEALAQAVKHTDDSDPTKVVSVAQTFYAFLTNPGGGTPTIAPAAVPAPAPEVLGAEPNEVPATPVEAAPVEDAPAPEAPVATVGSDNATPAPAGPPVVEAPGAEDVTEAAPPA